MLSKGNPNPRTALALLLGINLFNYIDRQVLAAVEPEIRATFFAPGDHNAMFKTSLLGMAFLITYMISAPALGWLADRISRWVIIGASILMWSLATGASGLAATFGILVLTRVFVGIGEGGYGPAAPTILADLFPLEKRARIMAIFCAAIPVGSALGYVIGGWISPHLGWRWAFYVVTLPGILLGAWCFLQRDPRGVGSERKARQKVTREDYRKLRRTRSFIFNSLGQTAMTFVAGGLAFWIAAYLQSRGQPPQTRMIFGGITVVAGLLATIAGGILADKLRPRIPGAYFLVSGAGMLGAAPFFIAMLFTPFPAAWFLMFAAVFLIFLNTGPSNAALANVTDPSIRERAFGLNILIIHLFGDVAAFPIIGYIGGHWNMTIAFLVVSVVIVLSGVFWIMGMKYLPADTAAVDNRVVR